MIQINRRIGTGNAGCHAGSAFVPLGSFRVQARGRRRSEISIRGNLHVVRADARSLEWSYHMPYPIKCQSCGANTYAKDVVDCISSEYVIVGFVSASSVYTGSFADACQAAKRAVTGLAP